MIATQKAAVPDSSIGVDVEQPLTNNNNEIITDSKKQINQQATNINKPQITLSQMW